eukprot:tig00001250_g7799.t1
MCRCVPAERNGQPYLKWVATWFGDCLYGSRDNLSFIVGLSSICFWIFCQTPQVIENYKNSSAEALSPIFLAIWLVGDSLNLIGAILTQQLPTQIYTAVYFVFMDTVVISQYTYYHLKNYVFKKPSIADSAGSSYGTAGAPSGKATRMVAAALMTVTLAARSLAPAPWEVPDSSLAAGGRVLLQLAKPHPPVPAPGSDEPICRAPLDSEWAVQLGVAVGWGSAFLYLASRLPQIVKNFRRKSTEGLAIGMFVAAVMGNLTYALAIFIRSMDPVVLYGQLPWIIGSVGTLCFDFTIFTQFHLYRARGTQYDQLPQSV